jgi:hypothetical protein
MEQDDWGSISRAIEIIKETSSTSTGAAQARLIEACASGEVRTRTIDDPAARAVVYLLADDGLMSSDFRPGARNPNAVTSDGKPLRRPRTPGPIPSLAWRDGTIDGNRLVDASGERWSRVEINIDDLRYWLGVASPVGVVERHPPASDADLRKFVASYIDKAQAAGKSPTQIGLCEAARVAGLEATRDRLVYELKQRVAPISGRPRKSHQGKVAKK